MSEELNNDELEYDILTLIDEDGVEHEFELVDTLDYKDNEYVALVPIRNDPNEYLEDSGELVIMKVAEEDGEQFLDAVENDEEYSEVSEIIVQRLSDYFDFEDEEQHEKSE